MGGPKDERDQRQELDDLNNERAGNETGRIKRFLPDRDPKHLEAKKQDAERRLSALMQMLRKSAYAAAYEETWNAYERAQSAVDEALTETADAIERLEGVTGAMDARAHRLGDEAVFQDENGRFYRADGSALTDEETARVDRSADAPSFEARRQAQEALEAAQARRAEILEIQATVLDPARDRLNDQNNPMSKDELRALADELNEVRNNLPRPEVGRHFDSAVSGASGTPPPTLALDDLHDPLAPSSP